MIQALEHKPDFLEAAERMAAFWEHRELDRPAIWLTAPRETPLPGPPAPAPTDDPQIMWLDQDYRFALGEAQIRQTHFLAEAFPAMQTQLGPGSLALHLGSQGIYRPTTIWYEPCIDDLTAGPDLAYLPDEPTWQWTVEYTRRCAEAGQGRYIVALPDIIENLDIIASLRGSLELLVEMVDAPAAVHRYQEQVLELYFRYYDELATLARIYQTGSLFVSFPGWSPGRVCKLQCDMSAMISPGMFREFVLPYLRAQCRRLDHCFYHLDGRDAICHLPALLEIDELHGIQWTPGAGTDPVHSERWWPLYHQIQEAGKSNFILGVPAGAVKGLLEEFDPSLTFISTGCATLTDAEALLASL